MKINEVEKEKMLKYSTESNGEKKKKIIEQVAFFFLGFLYSLAGFGKGFSPFGVSLSCSAPKTCLI